MYMQSIKFVTGIVFMLSAITLYELSLAAPSNKDVNVRSVLERVALKRVFFGHQSVGMNLLDGVKQLASTEGIPIRVVEVNTASEVTSSMIGHTFIAENGNPLKKIKSFEQAMATHDAEPDIALMKFCFVDFTAKTDVKALFSAYRSTIERLKAIHPDTTFVHVTVPLTTIQGGFKQNLKRLLGRPPYGTIENIRREEYNALLRQTYQGHEPIFDLAKIESTAPDGSVSTIEWEGKIAPAMTPSYTDDGGHLNAAGKLRAARELISVLATIPDSPTFRKTANK